MQLTGVPQVVAPLATGHPLGLPGAPVRTAEETKVQPVKEQSTTDTDHATDHGTEGQPPAGFWRSLTGLPDPANHVAPPSIMQIRISALLEEQAEALLKELRDKAIARMAAATPAPAHIDSDAPRPAEEARETRPGGEQGIEAAEKTAAGAPPSPRRVPRRHAPAPGRLHRSRGALILDRSPAIVPSRRCPPSSLQNADTVVIRPPIPPSRTLHSRRIQRVESARNRPRSGPLEG